MRPQKDFLKDETATAQLGAALGHVLRPGMTIHLQGDLGAGKTFLTREILRAMGYTGRVKSPSYTLLELYTVELQGHTVEVLHFDLYRMSSPQESSKQVFESISAATKSVSSSGRNKLAICFLQQISICLSLQKMKAVR
jgi:tRNA threonylcarbamoyl adenosine modification protein YjeE